MCPAWTRRVFTAHTRKQAKPPIIASDCLHTVRDFEPAILSIVAHFMLQDYKDSISDDKLMHMIELMQSVAGQVGRAAACVAVERL